MAESLSRDELARQSLTASKTLCFIAMIFPLLTTVGWIFGLPLLTRGLPALPVMHPNTALGLFLGSLSCGAPPYKRFWPVEMKGPPNIEG